MARLFPNQGRWTVEDYRTLVPVRLTSREYREPDVFFVSTPRVEEADGKYPNGADLVMEVVNGSRDDCKRNLVEKRYDYAQAGIPEYWIVDPDEGTIIVLRQEGEAYVENDRFSAPVNEVWAGAT